MWLTITLKIDLIMFSKIFIDHKYYTINLSAPLDIGIQLDPFKQNPTCFYAPQPAASPMDFNGFICAVKEGAPVNFFQVSLVPHGQGTHTECIGHIREAFDKITDKDIPAFMVADLISVQPEEVDGDLVIQALDLALPKKSDAHALVIRTRPNPIEKKVANYTESNPPYLSGEAMALIVESGYDHLLIDLPSVDKEQDEGMVLNHKAFWQINGEVLPHKTITEMIYVPNGVEDGTYVLQLQVANLALDAAPSHPLLYRIEDVVAEDSYKKKS